MNLIEKLLPFVLLTFLLDALYMTGDTIIAGTAQEYWKIVGGNAESQCSTIFCLVMSGGNLDMDDI